MKKARVGVVGVGRGAMMFQYCKVAENAEIVAICDKWEEGLRRAEKKLEGAQIAYYTDYDEFLGHDMDVVLLANYANEHTPFAIKAMNAGFHVISEVLPAQNMAEAVELIECVEKTGKIYCYAENYCYMRAPHEMRRRYRAGDIGELEYAEGEYIHNCEPIWIDITYGEPDHWRNLMHTFFYCTHSFGPIVHITGLRPVSVVGFELPYNDRMARMGCRKGGGAIEMITMENGAVVKSAHGDMSKNSIWYTVYGQKGRMESAREDAEVGGVDMFYMNRDEVAGVWRNEVEAYRPGDEEGGKSEAFGHGGSDYHCLYQAIEYVNGNKDADVIDVYEAVDMWLPGMFAYFSAQDGCVPKAIPNLRNPEEREPYRGDRRCSDPKAAGDQLFTPYTRGEVEIPDEVYAKQREEWLRRLKEKE